MPVSDCWRLDVEGEMERAAANTLLTTKKVPPPASLSFPSHIVRGVRGCRHEETTLEVIANP